MRNTPSCSLPNQTFSPWRSVLFSGSGSPGPSAERSFISLPARSLIEMLGIESGMFCIPTRVSTIEPQPLPKYTHSSQITHFLWFEFTQTTRDITIWHPFAYIKHLLHYYITSFSTQSLWAFGNRSHSHIPSSHKANSTLQTAQQGTLALEITCKKNSVLPCLQR